MSSKKNLLNTNKFIVKLVAMMKEFPSVMNWSEDGQQLQIYNVQLFTTQVHPKYFTTTNYKSFLRQLNMYNFSKMSKQKNSISFSHTIFRKGQQYLFQTIKRRKQPHKSLHLNRADFSDSLQQSSKQLCIEQQNPSMHIQIEVKELLSQVRQALDGRSNQAFLKLQRQIWKLLNLYKKRLNNSLEKPTQMGQIQDYFWMLKMDEIVRQSREVFSQSEYEYNKEFDIFKES